TETGDNAYTCIDVAIHKLERQLSRKKTKQRNNKHTGVTEKERGT
ncbi:MAG: HPF/RaiA family ribosome-associated protein, partial [Planctomycetota bacterium]